VAGGPRGLIFELSSRAAAGRDDRMLWASFAPQQYHAGAQRMSALLARG